MIGLKIGELVRRTGCQAGITRYFSSCGENCQPWHSCAGVAHNGDHHFK